MGKSRRPQSNRAAIKQTRLNNDWDETDYTFNRLLPGNRLQHALNVLPDERLLDAIDLGDDSSWTAKSIRSLIRKSLFDLISTSHSTNDIFRSLKELVDNSEDFGDLLMLIVRDAFLPDRKQYNADDSDILVSMMENWPTYNLNVYSEGTGHICIPFRAASNDAAINMVLECYLAQDGADDEIRWDIDGIYNRGCGKCSPHDEDLTDAFSKFAGELVEWRA